MVGLIEGFLGLGVLVLEVGFLLRDCRVHVELRFPRCLLADSDRISILGINPPDELLGAGFAMVETVSSESFAILFSAQLLGVLSSTLVVLIAPFRS
jgi:hypothetical protein